MLDKIKEYLAKYGVIAIFVIIGLVLITMFIMRNNILSLKSKLEEEKKEKDRIENNYFASQDTIKVYKDKNGNLVSQKAAYELKIEELDKDYKKLFKLYVKEKNKEPIVIVEYRTKIDEKITNISTIVSDTSIYFIDSVRYSNGSYRSIEGNIPYKITYHIKKNLVNKFAFEKALYFAYVLEENGVNDPKVVAFKNDRIISNKIALKDIEAKNLIYRVKITESKNKLSLKELSDKYKIKEELLNQFFDDGVYTYYAGNIIPSSNIEPMVDANDINIFGNLFVDKANINLKQGISLYTGLVKDTKTNKILIDVKSDYPGLTFDNIVGADIMSDPISRKVARDFRKEFGIGLNLGYGFFLVPDGNSSYVIKRGPEISLGLNWTPKFLQFGK
jgi:hypothetical protein